MMKQAALTLALACALVAGAAAQKQYKAWSEWSNKDAEKILNDSPWGQTQTEEDVSEMFFTPTTQGRATTSTGRGAPTTDPGNDRSTNGALNQATGVKFRIRFLSASPIRQALVRQIALKGGQITDQHRGFAENKESRVVVGVWFESTDQRFTGRVLQAFNSAVTETLKNTCYLERKDGKRIFVRAYVPPQQNPFGAAIFVFPREVDGQPLLKPDSGDVRFVAEFNKDLRLNMKYKVADMIYNGQLEY
ncbi:MAG TPA: hypothetical protein VF546_14630 [Pyrinomonadaceae bacterium]|jgi:hypothetical protein